MVNSIELMKKYNSLYNIIKYSILIVCNIYGDDDICTKISNYRPIRLCGNIVII